MATGDSLVRVRPQSSILAEMKAEVDPGPEKNEETPPPADPEEKIDPLPRPGREYKAYGHPPSRPQMSLFLVDQEYLPDGHAYADLWRCHLVPDKKDPGKGPVLVLHFSRAEVRIEGRKLNWLCHMIGLHRMPWVWQHPSPEECNDDTATLIRKITVTLVKE